MTFIISCQPVEREFREVIESDTLFVFDKNNTLRLKGPVFGGTKNGEFHSFDSLGNIRSIANYANDTLNGYYKQYYPSGIVRSDAYYVGGYPYGEELVFYDGYQDSTAIQIEGKWFIAPYSTHLKEYNYRDLVGKIMYQRNYDLEGNLTSKRGRLFLTKFYDSIRGTRNEEIEQAWLTPAPSGVDQIQVEQHFVIYGQESKDTIYIHSDSLVTRWNKVFPEIGIYEFEAVAYLIEGNNIETDTSKFTVEIVE
ncbi:toxin-antitoxin system YwqK family antitoxin [Reichenbachiella faecimaris]|uniref:toxin-antitoxin system YwqK family antitoxin n=1 Tax=Reichenbachiella faecimaris TaxID=692418 RepID=UPI000A051C3C|nr:hypothetical protein [Reichenbachiella faecimaris]